MRRSVVVLCTAVLCGVAALVTSTSDQTSLASVHLLLNPFQGSPSVVVADDSAEEVPLLQMQGSTIPLRINDGGSNVHAFTQKLGVDDALPVLYVAPLAAQQQSDALRLQRIRHRIIRHAVIADRIHQSAALSYTVASLRTQLDSLEDVVKMLAFRQRQQRLDQARLAGMEREIAVLLMNKIKSLSHTIAVAPSPSASPASPPAPDESSARDALLEHALSMMEQQSQQQKQLLQRVHNLADLFDQLKYHRKTASAAAEPAASSRTHSLESYLKEAESLPQNSSLLGQIYDQIHQLRSSLQQFHGAPKV